MSKKNRTTGVHGTQEWAASNVNIQNGCEHDCDYCYAKAMAIRFGRATPETWCEPEVRLAALAKTFAKRNGRIMFPTSHDITPGNIEACLGVLRRMLAAGNDVLIVSKPTLPCVERMCVELAEWRPQITFRFSIGSADDRVLGLWERGAPRYADRLECLQHAFSRGFSTSVSSEPILDENIDAVIDDVRPYVTDSIWLGKMNRVRAILRLNRPHDEAVAQRGEALLAAQSDAPILALYRRYRDDPLVKWKDSIKKVAALPRPEEAGLDV